jgi:hypothetical protein
VLRVEKIALETNHSASSQPEPEARRPAGLMVLIGRKIKIKIKIKIK